MISPGFGIVALVPLMIGATSIDPHRAESIVAGLCNGGAVVIPVGNREAPPPPPCSTKGCHAGCSRKRGLI